MTSNIAFRISTRRKRTKRELITEREVERKEGTPAKQGTLQERVELVGEEKVLF